MAETERLTSIRYTWFCGATRSWVIGIVQCLGRSSPSRLRYKEGGLLFGRFTRESTGSGSLFSVSLTLGCRGDSFLSPVTSDSTLRIISMKVSSAIVVDAPRLEYLVAVRKQCKILYQCKLEIYWTYTLSSTQLLSQARTILRPLEDGMQLPWVPSHCLFV
jgi:hypothetical protein